VQSVLFQKLMTKLLQGADIHDKHTYMQGYLGAGGFEYGTFNDQPF
jgi:hypothetical protein